MKLLMIPMSIQLKYVCHELKLFIRRWNSFFFYCNMNLINFQPNFMLIFIFFIAFSTENKKKTKLVM